jgi:hypothetical protein
MALGSPALLNRIYGYNDLLHFHYPLRRFYQDCLVNGDSFIWLPNLFCGIYLLGEGQAGLLHLCFAKTPTALKRLTVRASGPETSRPLS